MIHDTSFCSQPLLNNHPAFTNFLFDLEEPGDTGSEGSCDRWLSSEAPCNLFDACILFDLFHMSLYIFYISVSYV